MSDVTFKHPEYVKNLLLWEQVDDVCKGQKAVKDKRESYLPRNNPQDTSAEARGFYDSYLQRAVFYGVTGKTLGSLVGAAFATDPTFKYPTELEHLERNANGSGVSLYQLSQSTIRHVLKHYRCALYVDFPDVGPSRNRAEEKIRQAYPMIHLLSAKAVINWDTITIGNQTKLNLVVISESVSERGQDGFSIESKQQYRVLRLEDVGLGEFVYTIEVYTKSDKGIWTGNGRKIPTDYNGDTWSYIPFTFVGAVDNSAQIDNAPLLELTDLNLAHYRDSADFQESAYYMGQPQYYVTGVDWAWFKEARNNGVYVGSKTLMPIPMNGTLGIAQVQPNTLSREAMKDKWQQMKEMGARLVEKGSASKTATEADNDDAIQHSVLSLCVVNTNEAISVALRWCAKFVMPNVDVLTKDDSIFEISQEFSKQGYLADLSRQLFESAVQGHSSFKSWWEYNQSGMFPKQTYEEEKLNLETEREGKLDLTGE
ncbi:hypothetical protein B9T31_12180 [Acinetobacter sp. ANC 4558]|uniref:DUF4055 domain-containing protein n=1 Tax=Acinetobacter sp. ANC 4558 TaxID=1977876 RepID=UPI000A333BA4|nr:DUF4055 domain-containing protein [Acinetobacter sp. ANC 4558]OTG85542.1 hypothetical protein B9T31_12180 [Acinetobacter sp. ANC 4558]